MSGFVTNFACFRCTSSIISNCIVLILPMPAWFSLLARTQSKQLRAYYEVLTLNAGLFLEATNRFSGHYGMAKYANIAAVAGKGL